LLRDGIRAVRQRRNERAIRDAVVNSDLLLISYIKSGRTWLRFALSNYFADALQLGIEPDLRSTFSIIPNLDNDPVRGIPGFRFSSRRPDLPLILVSHQPSRQQLAPKTPTVFVVRDPRDIIVSSYFHATRHKHRFAGDLENFIGKELESIISYFNQWAEELERRPHLVTSYERISADLALELRRILAFLSVPVDEQALQRAVKRSEFGEMQSQERRTGIPGHQYDVTDDESLRMRKGKAGGYIDYLSPAQEGQIMTRCGEELTPRARTLLADFSTELAPIAD
jgi:hypothetical protein